MKLLDKLFKKKITDEQVALLQLHDGIKILESHLIAIARLQFIKPETLVREADNTKSNAEYLFKLIQQKEKNDK